MTTLSDGLNDGAAFQYATESLLITLREIGHSSRFIAAAVSLLERLRTAPKSQHERRLANFHDEFSNELDVVYRTLYEAHRKEFFFNHVFPLIPTSCEHLVDLGCGRGWVSKWMHDAGIARRVTGIDPVDFGDDWDQVKRWNGSEIAFKHVAIGQQSDWFKSVDDVSCVVCNWVFHHSTNSELHFSLKALGAALPAGAKMVVLEDAPDLIRPPKRNNCGQFEKWVALNNGRSDKYSKHQFYAQVILDFVAVRLLARYQAVEMDFNYKPVQDWQNFALRHGFKLETAEFIGFPKFRDIAVPQSVMVFRKQR